MLRLEEKVTVADKSSSLRYDATVGKEKRQEGKLISTFAGRPWHSSWTKFIADRPKYDPAEKKPKTTEIRSTSNEDLHPHLLITCIT